MTLPVNNIDLDHLGTATVFPDATVAIQHAAGQNRLVIAIVSTNGDTGESLDSASLDGVQGTLFTQATEDNGNGAHMAVLYWVDSQLPALAGDVIYSHTMNGSVSQQRVHIYQYADVTNQVSPLGNLQTRVTADATITDNANGAQGTLSVPLSGAINKQGFVCVTSSGNPTQVTSYTDNIANALRSQPIGTNYRTQFLFSIEDIVGSDAQTYDLTWNVELDSQPNGAIQSIVAFAFSIDLPTPDPGLFFPAYSQMPAGEQVPLPPGSTALVTVLSLTTKQNVLSEDILGTVDANGNMVARDARLTVGADYRVLYEGQGALNGYSAYVLRVKARL